MSVQAGGFEAVIGLEVHCQLATRTKIFCACPARVPAGTSVSELEPNSRVCPVCVGHPGTLPVLNRRAVEYAVRTGLAVGARIRNHSVIARKNYFYPDLPKGYQLTQFDEPICEHGLLEIGREPDPLRVRIKRIHLEEDAGKSSHEFGSSLVNLNRAGVPLIEIVTEPDLRTPEQAGAYLRELHSLVVALGVTDGNLQEGNFRCDANISIRPAGSRELGTRVEIKNVNSFRFVEKALHFEIARQIAVVQSGKPVIQETRLYDSQKDVTQAMRSKEEAEDYRYFPDPDLLAVVVPESEVERIRSGIPELPAQKRARWESEYGLAPVDARTISVDAELSSFFEAGVATGLSASGASVLAHLLIGEFSRRREEGLAKITPALLAQLSRALEGNELSSTAAKKVLGIVWNTGESVATVIDREGLRQVSTSSELGPVVDEVMAKNPQAVEELRAGKEKVIGFLVGQMMKLSGGKANPEVLRELLRARIQGKQ